MASGWWVGFCCLRFGYESNLSEVYNEFCEISYYTLPLSVAILAQVASCETATAAAAAAVAVLRFDLSSLYAEKQCELKSKEFYVCIP